MHKKSVINSTQLVDNGQESDRPVNVEINAWVLTF